MTIEQIVKKWAEVRYEVIGVEHVNGFYVFTRGSKSKTRMRVPTGVKIEKLDVFDFLDVCLDGVRKV